MSRDDDRILDALVDAADAETIDSGRDRPLPDFAAVVARARQLAPASGGRSDGRATTGISAKETHRDADALLDRLVGAAQACAQASVQARRLRPAPPLRRAPQRSRRAALAAAMGVVVATAAAVALTGSLRGDAWDEAERREANAMAAAHADREAAAGQAHAPPPEERRAHRERSRAAEASPSVASPTLLPETELPDTELPDTELPDTELPDTELPDTERPKPFRTAPHRTAPEVRTSRAADLTELDRRARQALAGGDLAGADAILGRLIARGGTSRLAEAAFGDRFALAHRLHPASTQRQLWRTYLARFPNGRFADDATAGLCRRAPQDGQACWSAYLAAFPTGGYRAQAERALQDQDPGPASEPGEQP